MDGMKDCGRCVIDVSGGLGSSDQACNNAGNGGEGVIRVMGSEEWV